MATLFVLLNDNMPSMHYFICFVALAIFLVIDLTGINPKKILFESEQVIEDEDVSICEIFGAVLASCGGGDRAFSVVKYYLNDHYETNNVKILLKKVTDMAGNPNYDDSLNKACSVIKDKYDNEQKEFLMNLLCKISDDGTNNSKTMDLIMKIGKQIEISKSNIE